jgi:nicotinate-nucleotide pyrophosphorylase (carboxylating)
VHQAAASELLEWIKEDAPLGDITTELLIPEDVKVVAVVLAKEECIVAGTEDLARALEMLGVQVDVLRRSGERAAKGDTIMKLKGYARTILLVERTLLNVLSYLCGVATATRLLVEKARKVNPKVRIAATRKTPPYLRYLAKRAVAAGGGDTHRMSLSDAILIKDNHLAIVGSVEEAVKRARKKASFIHKVEVEVSSLDEAIEAARAGADVIMADNVDPHTLREIVSALQREGLRDKVLVEVSGGITPENVEQYAAAGPDIISTSYMTMKARAVDLSLEVVEVVSK